MLYMSLSPRGCRAQSGDAASAVGELPLRPVQGLPCSCSWPEQVFQAPAVNQEVSINQSSSLVFSPVALNEPFGLQRPEFMQLIPLVLHTGCRNFLVREQPSANSMQLQCIMISNYMPCTEPNSQSLRQVQHRVWCAVSSVLCDGSG